MLKKEDLLTLQKSLGFWNYLNDSQKDLLLTHTAIAHYKQGETLHNGENDCVGILIVKSGCIRTYMLSDKGKEITLYRLYEGDLCLLSASCILKSITFDVHIDAEEDSDLFLIHSSAFSTLIKENIYVENFSYKAMTEKFSDVMWAMEQILFMSFDQRLAIFLLDESIKCQSHTLKLTHEQIAKYMGSAREVVSRMLKYFVKEGLVELSRGGITLINIPKLKEMTH